MSGTAGIVPLWHCQNCGQLSAYLHIIRFLRLLLSLRNFRLILNGKVVAVDGKCPVCKAPIAAYGLARKGGDWWSRPL